MSQLLQSMMVSSFSRRRLQKGVSFTFPYPPSSAGVWVTVHGFAPNSLFAGPSPPAGTLSTTNLDATDGVYSYISTFPSNIKDSQQVVSTPVGINLISNMGLWARAPALFGTALVLRDGYRAFYNVGTPQLLILKYVASAQTILANIPMTGYYATSANPFTMHFNVSGSGPVSLDTWLSAPSQADSPHATATDVAAVFTSGLIGMNWYSSGGAQQFFVSGYSGTYTT